MPYTHFRFIAYEVPTATHRPGGKVESGFDAGQEYQFISRIPVPGNIPDDARKRLKRLAGIVNLAANRLKLELADNDNTLKIFMAPEFYFRPPAALGGNYRSDTYPNSVAAKIFSALGEMFTHADFKNWLIVPGSIMWNTSEDTLAPKVIFYNSSFQITGGPVAKSGDNLNYIEKEMPSGIDGVPYGPGMDPNVKLAFESWKSRKHRVFKVDNIDCGLEICLDHGFRKIGEKIVSDHRVLKKVLNDWPSKEGSTREINLHLLTAGGMPLNPASVAAKVNGYILRNDGYSDTPHSELKKVLRYTCPEPLMGILTDCTPSDLSGTAHLDTAVKVEKVYPVPEGALQVPMKGDNYFKFPQQVVFYETQPFV